MHICLSRALTYSFAISSVEICNFQTSSPSPISCASYNESTLMNSCGDPVCTCLLLSLLESSPSFEDFKPITLPIANNDATALKIQASS